ncbi:MAG: hypothetical protein ACXU86_23080 [Archangium sp.]
MPPRTPSLRLSRSSISLENPRSQRLSRERATEPLAAPVPTPVLPAAPGSLSVASSTARLAFETLMALDLDGDGRLTQRDAGLARVGE